ncbi:hypothetical protein [Pedobacter sp. ok626]|uniref:hypothetical protein n=1 Tax=Pedobacter sp. ok626 TaxID=1761882 RepID=UPI000B85E9FC|nr:hypothetical protein [Pedobacter sp. ok626]
MKPIHEMKLHQKIKILYKLYPASIVEFTDYLKACAIETIEDREEAAETSGKCVVQQDYCVLLAMKTFDRIKQYGESFFYCRKLFTKQLFKGSISLFTVHTLLRYAETKYCSPKFALAVKLFIEI